MILHIMTGGTIKTTKTVFDIIEALKRFDGAGVSEIAEYIDLAPSTVHDHLSTLESLEYIRREGNEYQLGLRFLDYGIYAKERLELTDAIQPALDQLADDTGESAWIIAEEHGWGVNIEGSTGERGVRTGERVGWRTYLHVHAAGKAILAHLPDERIEEIIDLRSLPQLTENTITDRDKLYDELNETRDRGYACDRSEGIEGLRAVAAPIIVNDLVHGAVTVAGPANRMKGSKFTEEIPDAVLGAANTMELNLTYK